MVRMVIGSIKPHAEWPPKRSPPITSLFGTYFYCIKIVFKKTGRKQEGNRKDKGIWVLLKWILWIVNRVIIWVTELKFWWQHDVGYNLLSWINLSSISKVVKILSPTSVINIGKGSFWCRNWEIWTKTLNKEGFMLNESWKRTILC